MPSIVFVLLAFAAAYNKFPDILGSNSSQDVQVVILGQAMIMQQLIHIGSRIYYSS